MAGLTGKTPAGSYKDLLFVDNSNNGVASTLNIVKTGDGNSSALQVADDGIHIQQVNNDTGTPVLSVADSSGTKAITITSAPKISGTLIKDEDNMSSDSDDVLCTQQSIKAYVDTYAKTFYMNCSFYGRISASNLIILGTGDTSQWHDTGGTSLTTIDGEALMHGSFFQANKNTTFVGATGFIGGTSTGMEDISIYFLLSDAYTADQTGNFTITNLGSVSQADAITQNDSYYVTTTLNSAMTAGKVLMIGAILGTGSNKYLSGNLTLEFLITA